MYEQGGILTSEDGTMAVLAGATLGGGTRINWCASFKTPQHVRCEAQYLLEQSTGVKLDGWSARVLRWVRCYPTAGFQGGVAASTSTTPTTTTTTCLPLPASTQAGVGGAARPGGLCLPTVRRCP